MITRTLAGCRLAIGLWGGLARAQTTLPFPTTPTWESYATGVSTGGGLVDLDRDGDLDLVVANGNDILRQHVEVYYNDGRGHFPVTPPWQSSDIDYHGHVSIGDVTGDGWPDVAVSVFLGPSGFGQPGDVKLYVNDGTGTLGAAPAWRSADNCFSFACALGDADGDGDLDLAVSNSHFESGGNVAILLNAGDGAFALPVNHLTGTGAEAIAAGDLDGDSDLDLVVANRVACTVSVLLGVGDGSFVLAGSI